LNPIIIVDFGHCTADEIQLLALMLAAVDEASQTKVNISAPEMEGLAP
jgi:hypothetical protein